MSRILFAQGDGEIGGDGAAIWKDAGGTVHEASDGDTLDSNGHSITDANETLGWMSAFVSISFQDTAEIPGSFVLDQLPAIVRCLCGSVVSTTVDERWYGWPTSPIMEVAAGATVEFLPCNDNCHLILCEGGGSVTFNGVGSANDGSIHVQSGGALAFVAQTGNNLATIFCDSGGLVAYNECVNMYGTLVCYADSDVSGVLNSNLTILLPGQHFTRHHASEFGLLAADLVRA